jgi:hypothetical protein
MGRFLSAAAFAACLLPAVTLAQPAAAPQGKATDLRISFIDVGQGDAIWIRTPAAGGPSRNIIVDGGPDRGGLNRVVKYLQTYGVPPGSTIDYLILTHPHDDHYPAQLDLLALYDVRTIVHSGFPKSGEEYAKFVRAANAERVGGRSATVVGLRQKPDFTMDWGGGVIARILHDARAGSGHGAVRRGAADRPVEAGPAAGDRAQGGPSRQRDRVDAAVPQRRAPGRRRRDVGTAAVRRALSPR